MTRRQRSFKTTPTYERTVLSVQFVFVQFLCVRGLGTGIGWNKQFDRWHSRENAHAEEHGQRN
jgi:hypothetical protein